MFQQVLLMFQQVLLMLQQVLLLLQPDISLELHEASLPDSLSLAASRSTSVPWLGPEWQNVGEKYQQSEEKCSKKKRCPDEKNLLSCMWLGKLRAKEDLWSEVSKNKVGKKAKCQKTRGKYYLFCEICCCWFHISVSIAAASRLGQLMYLNLDWDNL